MKTYLYILSLFVLFSSCASTTYVSKLSNPISLSLKESKVLLNSFSTDIYSIDNKDLDKVLNNKLKEKNSFSYTKYKDDHKANGIKKIIPFDIKARDIYFLRRAKKYDYIVNTNAKLVSPKDKYLPYVETELEIRIYSVKDVKEVYSYKLVAKANLDESVYMKDRNENVFGKMFRSVTSLFSSPDTREQKTKELVEASIVKAVEALNVN